MDIKVTGVILISTPKTRRLVIPTPKTSRLVISTRVGVHFNRP